jgi:hypothetical protein
VNCTRWKPRPRRQRRLAQARQVLDQHVAIGQQGHERQPHFVGLAQHPLVDLRLRALEGVVQIVV